MAYLLFHQNLIAMASNLLAMASNLDGILLFQENSRLCLACAKSLEDRRPLLFSRKAKVSFEVHQELDPALQQCWWPRVWLGMPRPQAQSSLFWPCALSDWEGCRYHRVERMPECFTKLFRGIDLKHFGNLLEPRFELWPKLSPEGTPATARRCLSQSWIHTGPLLQMTWVERECHPGVVSVGNSTMPATTA